MSRMQTQHEHTQFNANSSSMLLTDYQVIFAIPSGMISGVDIFTTHLVRQLIERGIRAKIVCTKPPSSYSTAARLAEDLPIEPLLFLARYNAWPTRWQAMIDYLEAEAPCIYIPNYDYDYSAVTPKLSERIKVVGIVHSDSAEHYEHLLRLGHSWDAIVGVSQAISRQVEFLQPTLAPRLHTIPYGVAVSPALPEKPSAATAPLRVIYCGRLEQEQKRVLDLIHIAKRLEELQIPFMLSIIGDGPAREKMQELSAALGVQAYLHFTGKLPNQMVIQHLRQSDVFLLTSAYEGLPVSLLEAMANGVVPLVSAIRSGIPEMIRHAENGLLAAIGDIDGFAKQLAYLYANPMERRQMANAAQMTISHSGYRLEDMVDQYCALFQTMIEQPFTRPRGDILPPARLKHQRSWLRLARHRAGQEVRRAATQVKHMLAGLSKSPLPKDTV